MRGRQVLLNAQQVERRRGGGRAPVLPFDFPAEGMLLQVEETGRALQVRQGMRWRVLQPLEHLAARQRPLELAYEFLQVALHDSIQVDQLAVDVVQHLHLRWRPHEVQRGTAGENLDVASVRWKLRDDAVGQASFAADPGDDGKSQNVNLLMLESNCLPEVARAYLVHWPGQRAEADCRC